MSNEELARLVGGDEFDVAIFEIRRDTNSARRRLGLPERRYPEPEVQCPTDP